MASLSIRLGYAHRIYHDILAKKKYITDSQFFNKKNPKITVCEKGTGATF